jgi:hypothetical protein
MNFRTFPSPPVRWTPVHDREILHTVPAPAIQGKGRQDVTEEISVGLDCRGWSRKRSPDADVAISIFNSDVEKRQLRAQAHIRYESLSKIYPLQDQICLRRSDRHFLAMPTRKPHVEHLGMLLASSFGVNKDDVHNEKLVVSLPGE